MKFPRPWEIVAVAGIIAVLAFLFWPVHNDKVSAKRTACLSNIKQLAIASIIYSVDYDERFAGRDTWRDSIRLYTESKDSLVCPVIFMEKNPQLYGFAFYGKLSNAKPPPEPQTVALIFESINLSRNASGDLASLPNPGRHPSHTGGKGSYNIAYADGHAKNRAVE